jgi:hypothetical protein
MRTRPGFFLVIGGKNGIIDKGYIRLIAGNTPKQLTPPPDAICFYGMLIQLKRL